MWYGYISKYIETLLMYMQNALMAWLQNNAHVFDVCMVVKCLFSMIVCELFVGIFFVFRVSDV